MEVFNNGFILQACKATTGYNTFPIAFKTRVMAVTFGQSGYASASVQRLAFKTAVTLTGFEQEAVSSGAYSKGAYYIAVGY